MMIPKKRLSSVSFFCPAYNDEKNLPILIPNVFDFLKKITDTFEIIIVHDGSPDKTGQVADQLAREFPNVRVIHHPFNMGYGAALRDGFNSSVCDYIMYTDGDNQYDVREFLPRLHLLDGVDLISGYAREKSMSLSLFRKFQSRLYNWLIRTLFSVDYRDINCSMKIYNRNILDNISIVSSSAYVDAEMIIKTTRAGFKVAQFPVTHFPRREGVASGSNVRVIISTIKDMLIHRFGV